MISCSREDYLPTGNRSPSTTEWNQVDPTPDASLLFPDLNNDMWNNLMETTSPWHGLPIDCNDKHGDPIHVGDTLRFDEREWGEPHTFVIGFERAEVLYSGGVSDLDCWCEIIRRYDGTVVRA